MKAQLYIDGERVELFQDELITVNSSVANIQDISKVFSDYSQTFNVPATPSNNRIFEHWYQTDVLPNIDSRLRRDAFIEVQLIPFRYGKIQLNEAVIRGGRVVSYSLTFYGSLTSLKDRFGEDELKDLDYSTIGFTYDGAEVYNRLIDGTTSYDVRFPLVSPNRLWQSSGGGVNDITVTAGRMVYEELFPAVRVQAIFNFIETKYNLSFVSSFFSTAKWLDLYFRIQNKQTVDVLSGRELIDLTAISITGNPLIAPFDASTDIVRVITGLQTTIDITLSGASDTTADFIIETHVDGALFSTSKIEDTEFVGGTVTKTIAVIPSSSNSLPVDVQFFIYSSKTGTVNQSIKVDSALGFGVLSTNTTTFVINATNLFNSSMKVADFVAGILKVFNLVVVGEEADTFTVEPLQDWYALGQTYDITPYVVNSHNVQRVPLYKQISFNYKESKSFPNRNFRQLFNREYGDLSSAFPYDGSEFKIEVPFENNQFTEIDNTDIFVAFCLDENQSPYVPEPMLMYLSGDQACTSFKFFDGTTEQTISSYALFNSVNTTGFSLCFGNEFNIVTQQTEPDSLYNTYYAQHLSNLYDIQQRMFSFTAFFPTGLMTKLRMNDRLIIHDRRYFINDISTTLNNGEVKMNLLRELVTFEPNCECIKITYQLVGEEPVTVEVEQDRSGSFLPFYIDNPPTPITGIWISFIDNEWVISSGMSSPITTQATLSEDTPCPFGTYTIDEGSIFESFVVEPCY